MTPAIRMRCFVALSLALAALPAWSQANRCETQVGESKRDLMTRCGPPTSKSRTCVVPPNQGVPDKLVNQPSVAVPCQMLETWIYQADGAQRTVRMLSGRVETITDDIAAANDGRQDNTPRRR